MSAGPRKCCTTPSSCTPTGTAAPAAQRRKRHEPAGSSFLDAAHSGLAPMRARARAPSPIRPGMWPGPAAWRMAGVAPGRAHRDQRNRPAACASRACRAGTTTTTHPSGPRTACRRTQRACVRHWIWLGRAIQIDLTAVPEIIHAHQDAFRLACRYGVTRFVLAEVTVRQQAAATPVDGCPHVQRRIAVLASSNPGLDWGTRTRPRPQPTPRRSRWPPKSSALPGQNPYWAGMTDTTFPQHPAGPASMTHDQPTA